MTNKLFSIMFSFALIIAGVGMFSVQQAHAQPVFPAGCASNVGYSVINDVPCNGASVATTSATLMAGCPTALGYSTVNGAPCDGTTEAITFLNGCTSTMNYSTINNQPCNGTTLAATATDPDADGDDDTTTTPALPLTGAGGNASSNIVLLVASGLISALGVTYLARRSVVAK